MEKQISVGWSTEKVMLEGKINNLIAEKGQLESSIRKHLTDLAIISKKNQGLQNEVNQLKNQNQQVIQLFETEKKEKIQLLALQDSLNSQHFQQAQMRKLQSKNQILEEENQKIRLQMQALNTEKINLSKEKQNALNKLAIIESKMEAVQMGQEFKRVSLQQTVTENSRLKSEIQNLQKKIKEMSANSQVKTVFKDNSQTTERLVAEFQQKIRQRQVSYQLERAKSDKLIEQLQQKIGYFESELMKK